MTAMTTNSSTSVKARRMRGVSWGFACGRKGAGRREGLAAPHALQDVQETDWTRCGPAGPGWRPFGRCHFAEHRRGRSDVELMIARLDGATVSEAFARLARLGPIARGRRRTLRLALTAATAL